ncbi:MAG: hypothetical protein RIB47_13880 [Cyclobacteriaceae bacterium]
MFSKSHTVLFKSRLFIRLAIFIGASLVPICTQGQSRIWDLVKGTRNDANALLEGYIAPGMEALGDGLNQGWYNTAKTHKTFGIDLTITGSLMYIPRSEEFYTVNNNDLQSIKLTSFDGIAVAPNESAKVPTLFGPGKTPQYQVAPFAPFDGPPGLDLKNEIKLGNILPVPIYHLGIGLPKNFDLKVRWSPTVRVQDFEFNLYAIGVMHDIKQYFRGIREVPIELAVLVGYSHMEFVQNLSSSINAVDAEGVAKFNATTIQALISKKISVVTLYGALGYNFTSSSLGMIGSFDLDNDGNSTDINPLSLDFSSSSPRITGGARLKLAIFTLHADYTLAHFNALSVGVGLSVR